MSMIIGRKQIILAALVIALGAAIYLNYAFSGNISSVLNSAGTLGSASYVVNQNVSATSGSTTANYFSTARLNREQTRAKAEEVLKAQTTNASATAAEKQSAETAIETIAKNITTEGQIESMIKAKGFGDCMAFINQDTGGVTIVVKAKTGSTLSDSDNAQIDDIVIKQTKVSLSKITIMIAK